MTLLDHATGCAIYMDAQVCTCGAVNRLAADPPFVHPQAWTDGTAQIGPGAKVWQFASVTRGTVLGAGCSVAPFAVLDGPVIGDRTIISMHVAMGPGFRVGSDVFIGPGVVFCNDAWPAADKEGWDADMLRDGRCVAVIVEDGASIGASAVILPGVRIGKGAMVAAGAVCGKDVPAGHLFKRSGEIVEINTAWAKRRMKSASGTAARRNPDAPTPAFGLIVSGEAA